MEDSLFVKAGDVTGKFYFWLLDIRFLAKIKAKCSILRRIWSPSNPSPKMTGAEWGSLHGYSHHPNIYVDHNIFVATAAINNILKHFLDPISL